MGNFLVKSSKPKHAISDEEMDYKKETDMSKEKLLTHHESLVVHKDLSEILQLVSSKWLDTTKIDEFVKSNPEVLNQVDLFGFLTALSNAASLRRKGEKKKTVRIVKTAKAMFVLHQ